MREEEEEGTHIAALALELPRDFDDLREEGQAFEVGAERPQRVEQEVVGRDFGVQDEGQEEAGEGEEVVPGKAREFRDMRACLG